MREGEFDMHEDAGAMNTAVILRYDLKVRMRTIGTPTMYVGAGRKKNGGRRRRTKKRGEKPSHKSGITRSLQRLEALRLSRWTSHKILLCFITLSLWTLTTRYSCSYRSIPFC